MISTSRCILKNSKLLDAISFKSVSSLHLCANHQSLNRRSILCLYGHQKYSGFILKPIYAARLVSTKDAATQVTSIGADSRISAATPAESAIRRVKENVENELPMNNIDTASPVAETVTDSVVKTSVVLESPNVEVSKEQVEFPIPDVPVPPKYLDPGNLSLDPPFEQMGLGGWTPVGWVQNGFEYLHYTLGLPWWECIILGTVFVRTLLFPIMILSQRNAARLQNNQPKFQALQAKINEAKQRGENFEAARYTQDLVLFMKEKGINPLKSMLIPMSQAPVFLSFFMGIREMANIPVKSLHNGGLFWFTDLTVPDQFYLLPILTSITLFITIEVGAESGKMTNQNQHLIRYILRAIPVVMLPFTINFPTAILLYWASSNVISLGQVSLFQLPSVRKAFHIQPKIKHQTEDLTTVKKGKGFIPSVKEWWYDTRTQSAHNDRSRKNQTSFTAAGRGAVPKTYKYNPTITGIAQSSSSSVQAKKR